MLISRCEFSITLAASATFIEGAKCVPAVMTLYTFVYFCPISGVARSNFQYFLNGMFFIPGLILSGE
jgi:hypothetical protein